MHSLNPQIPLLHTPVQHSAPSKQPKPSGVHWLKPQRLF